VLDDRIGEKTIPTRARAHTAIGTTNIGLEAIGPEPKDNSLDRWAISVDNVFT